MAAFGPVITVEEISAAWVAFSVSANNHCY